MEPGNILQIIMIATGVLLLIVTVSSLARRKMTESFCLAWGLIALILVIAGFILRPSGWNRYISTMGMVLVVLIGFCAVYVAYFVSTKVSEISRRNQELAMQVSLLNQEQQRMLKLLEQLVEESEERTGAPVESDDSGDPQDGKDL